MTQAVFGRDIVRTFTLDDGVAPSVILDDTPTIYVFDYPVSRETALAGTGAIETVDEWTLDTPETIATYVIPAIPDPEPTSDTDVRKYWEAIIYTLQSSGEEQLELRTFTIRRAEVTTTEPETTPADVRAAWPSVDSYITELQLETFISGAEASVRRRVTKAKWPDLLLLDEAKFAIAYKAIIDMAASQVAKGVNPEKFIWMIQHWTPEYDAAIATLIGSYDSDEDGVVDVAVSPIKTMTVIR